MGIDAGSKTISFTLTNAGDVAGAEVAQLYLSPPAAANAPPQALKAFEKVSLEAGESTSVMFELTDRAISMWDTDVHDWAIVEGDYGVVVGASSRDARLTGKMTV